MAENAWDWSELSPARRRERWASLADWVDRLRRDYGPWVRLPACWALHEPLRRELAAFAAWEEEARAPDADPSETVRWHGELRAAAQAWSELEHCRHDDVRVRLDDEADVQRYLAEATRAEMGEAQPTRERTGADPGRRPGRALPPLAPIRVPPKG